MLHDEERLNTIDSYVDDREDSPRRKTSSPSPRGKNTRRRSESPFPDNEHNRRDDERFLHDDREGHKQRRWESDSGDERDRFRSRRESVEGDARERTHRSDSSTEGHSWERDHVADGHEGHSDGSQEEVPSGLQSGSRPKKVRTPRRGEAAIKREEEEERFKREEEAEREHKEVEERLRLESERIAKEKRDKERREQQERGQRSNNRDREGERRGRPAEEGGDEGRMDWRDMNKVTINPRDDKNRYKNARKLYNEEEEELQYSVGQEEEEERRRKTPIKAHSVDKREMKKTEDRRHGSILGDLPLERKEHLSHLTRDRPAPERRAPTRGHLQKVPLVAENTNLAKSQIIQRRGSDDDDEQDGDRRVDLIASAPASPLPASHAYNNHNDKNNRALGGGGNKGAPRSGIALLPQGAFNPAELRTTLHKTGAAEKGGAGGGNPTNNNPKPPEALTVRELLAERRLKKQEADTKGGRY